MIGLYPNYASLTLTNGATLHSRAYNMATGSVGTWTRGRKHAHDRSETNACALLSQVVLCASSSVSQISFPPTPHPTPLIDCSVVHTSFPP
jgi:hypothetical protein